MCEGKRGKNELFLVPATYLANAIGNVKVGTNYKKTHLGKMPIKKKFVLVVGLLGGGGRIRPPEPLSKKSLFSFR